jgi:hypothetical protein
MSICGKHIKEMRITILEKIGTLKKGIPLRTNTWKMSGSANSPVNPRIERKSWR